VTTPGRKPRSPRPRFFAAAADFRRWLAAHHSDTKELWVGFRKRATGKPSITWPESVDEALCFGWIDGVRKSVDDESYMIRFTPRREGSNWSAVNVRRMEQLTRRGRVRAAGRAAFAARAAEKTGIYSYENRHLAELDPAHERIFRADAAAWKYFQAQPPWYRKITTWRIVSAKKEETRRKRLAELIAASAAERWLPGLQRAAKRA
jgi:uncharacterized protein YdeI (YjbR/CyaY-like superfamily)